MKALIIDLETSIGTGPHKSEAKDPSNDFYTIIYGDHPERISIEHDPEGFKRTVPAKMDEMLKSSDIIVGHNLGFDLSYMWNDSAIKDFLITGGKIWDTQVAEYILTAQVHSFASLSELQCNYLGQKIKKDRISRLYKAGIGADMIIAAKRRCKRVWALYEQYCSEDGSTTLQIFAAQYRRAKAEGMLAIIELYNDYLLSVIEMQCSGIHLDTGQCERTLNEFKLKHLEFEAKAQECLLPMWNDPRLPAFNVNSPDHKSAILFGGNIKTQVRQLVGQYKNGKDKYKIGEELVYITGFAINTSLTQKTKKDGVFATGADIMEKIAETCTNPAIIEYCELQKEAMAYKKVCKTYLEAFLNLSINGILYPNFNNTLTITGRLSSSKPNMQNISKRNKFAKDLHRLFVAPEGWTCMQADFSQLEIYVEALLSGDKSLQHDLQTGVDMHCRNLSYYDSHSYQELVDLCKHQQVPEYVHMRTMAKTVSYQAAYGAAPKSIAKSTGLEESVIKTILAGRDAEYPLTAEFNSSVIDIAKNNMKLSYAKDIPRVKIGGSAGSRLRGSVELLPIFDKDKNVRYNEAEIRNVGYWKSMTGKKYAFFEMGSYDRFGKLRRNIVIPQTKNYPKQGTAADIQGATTAFLQTLLWKNTDKVKMINEVHDSKWFYIKNEYVGTIIPIIKKLVEDVPTIFKKRFNLDVDFKFPVDIETGPNFAELEKYEPKD